MENQTQVDETQEQGSERMSLSEEQKNKLNELIECRFKIEQTINEIESILQIYFSEEFGNAYQHWIPQIKTALFNNTKWLPRGQFTMEDTISRLVDKSQESDKKGVSKYI